MIKTVLQRALTEKQQAAGLSLIESDDRILELHDKEGEELAVWYSSAVNIIEIRKEADKHILS